MRSDQDRLSDILEAIDRIHRHTAGFARTSTSRRQRDRDGPTHALAALLDAIHAGPHPRRDRGHHHDASRPDRGVHHEEHQLPHVAVRGEHRATVRLEDGQILAGHLPAKLHRAVRRFLAEHRDEAYAAWVATQRREPPDRL